MTLCVICEKRRPRRYCPGVRGDICSICCGTEREVTVNCPFDCPYLEEARLRETPSPVDPKTFPNRDVPVTDAFVMQHEPLLVMCARALAQSSAEVSDAIDLDAREALDALIRTYRTLNSGLIYETRPANPIAAHLQHRFKEIFEEMRQRFGRETSMEGMRDNEVLGMLVFLQRLELSRNNGRPRSRAFLHSLRTFLPPEQLTEPAILTP